MPFHSLIYRVPKEELPHKEINPCHLGKKHRILKIPTNRTAPNSLTILLSQIPKNKFITNPPPSISGSAIPQKYQIDPYTLKNRTTYTSLPTLKSRNKGHSRHKLLCSLCNLLFSSTPHLFHLSIKQKKVVMINSAKFLHFTFQAKISNLFYSFFLHQTRWENGKNQDWTRKMVSYKQLTISLIQALL